VAKKQLLVSCRNSETEQDPLSHIQDGYQLATDSGTDPFCALKRNEEIRPLSANRNTIKAMERRGLINPGKGLGSAHYRVAFEKEIN
jgi:hypothetical protein